MMSFAQTSDAGGRMAEALLTERDLAGKVEFLTDTLCDGRASFSRGGVEASFWIARRFEHYGLLPFRSGGPASQASYFQSFRSSDKVGHNVIGFCPASAPSDRYVIVGAHYDNLGVLSGRYYPGADSNASGVAVMLDLAHMFRSLSVLGHSSSQNIIFVAFDAKQLSMAGSNALYRALERGALLNPVDGSVIRPDQVSMMVNIDIVGSTLEPVHKGREDYLIMLSDDDALKRRLSEANFSSRMSLDLSFDYYGSKDFTDLFFKRICDQRVFIEHGIPSVLFTSGITMLTNKVDDTPESLNIPVLHKRALLIFRWLEKVLS